MKQIPGKQNKWLVFAVTGLANIIVSFSINSMTLALPTLEKEFSVGQSAAGWVAMVYTLVPCCTLLILGRAAELIGYKRQMKIGFLFFGAVCLAAPLLSRTFGMLIFFRCLEGLGYSVMVSITQAIVGRSFPENERGKAIGVNSVFVSAGMAAGPTVGGLLLAHFSWHALFYFNIPFCLAGFWAVCRFLPDDEPPKKRGHMDAPGAVLLAFAVGAVVIGLNLGGGWGFASAPFLGCMIAGAVGLAAFILREKRAASPLIQLRLFKNRTFSLAGGASMGAYLGQQIVTYLLSYYLINMLLLRSDAAGFVMLISPALMMVFAPLAGSLADRRGTRLPAVIGLGLVLTASAVMGAGGGTLSLVFAVIALVLAGIGSGFTVAPINSAIMNAAPPESAGIASGTLATVRNLGNTLGVLCATVILSARQPVYGLFSARDAYLFAQRDTFYFGALINVLAMALIFLLPRRKRGRAAR